MSVDPALHEFAREIESGQPWPRPGCPACGRGHIRFESPVNAESLASERGHPGFDWGWIRGTFAILGECENPNCRQTVHGTGDYRVDHAEKSYPSAEEQLRSGPPYSAFYRVAHLHPPILLMPIPRSAPDEVKEAVLRASRVLYVDPGLAATALRAAVERFMTTERIAATNVQGRFRNAHIRIEEWRGADSTRAPVADLFFAVKWLGNTGTHEDSTLTTAEVLDGAELLDEAFHRIYTGPDLDAMAQTITAAHRRGPTQ